MQQTLGVLALVDTNVLWLLLEISELGSSNDEDTFRQTSCDTVVVNVVADSEALFEFGDEWFAVAVDLTLANNMKNVAIVFQLQIQILQVNSGNVKADLIFVGALVDLVSRRRMVDGVLGSRTIQVAKNGHHFVETSTERSVVEELICKAWEKGMVWRGPEGR